jgi:hypothetical protein
MLTVMGRPQTLIAWVAVVAFASLSPSASAGAEFSLFSTSASDGDSDGRDWRSPTRDPAAPSDGQAATTASAPSVEVDTASPSVDERLLEDPMSCSPVAHLQRQWFGGAVLRARSVEEEFLSPVAVIGQVEALLPGLGGLLAPVTTPVKATVDVAAFAVWDEEFVRWDTYTDDLYVGLASLDPAGFEELGAEGWQVQGFSLECGPASRGTTFVQDPRADEVSYTCLTCLDLPADGWVLVGIEHLNVYLAKARDYQVVPPGYVCVCPAEVVQAVQDEIDELAPTYADAIRQLAERPV